MHSCTVVLQRGNRLQWGEMRSLTIVLHVFSQTGQPLPSSSSKGKERKGSEGQLGVYSPASTAPEVKAPSRAANPAPVSSISPTLWSPRGPSSNPDHPSPSASPCGDTAVVGVDHRGNCRVYYHGDGLQSIVLENWNANLFHGMFTSWQESRLLSICLCKPGPWKRDPLPFQYCQRPPPPHPLLLMPGRHRLDWCWRLPFSLVFLFVLSLYNH